MLFRSPSLFQGDPMDTHDVSLVSLLHTVWGSIAALCFMEWTSPFATAPQAAVLQPKGSGCVATLGCLSSSAVYPLSSFACKRVFDGRNSDSCTLHFCCQRLGGFITLLFTLRIFWPSEWSTIVFHTKYNSTRVQLIIYLVVWVELGFFGGFLRYCSHLSCGRTLCKYNVCPNQIMVILENVFTQPEPWVR